MSTSLITVPLRLTFFRANEYNLSLFYVSSNYLDILKVSSMPVQFSIVKS